eukprot:TRINITY_DN26158_c0_g2_i1.p1 TRINITY_DN26158_c0_g2~~TRINITY_DN26158_c0_g2_i1.p1  ORF type:complete len:378 (+),score=71.48 TRINITY_DN26158_c0_g2_i1:68-1135(+)
MAPTWLSGNSKSPGPSEDEQSAAIQQLRGRFEHEDVTLTDASLRRFLVTRKWKVDEAAQLLQNHVKWRQEFGLPVPKDEVQPTLAERRIILLGKGSTGRPVLMMNFGRLLEVNWSDPKEMHRHVRASVYAAETMVSNMAEGVEQWISVINCTGIRQPPAAFLREFTDVIKPNYPERAEKIVIYPIPRIVVRLAQSFISTFIPEKTGQKVVFVHGLQDLCKETGLGTDQLPPELMDANSDAALMKNATIVEVPAGKKEVYRQELPAGTNIKWEFRVLEHTVSCKIRLIAQADKSEVVELGCLERVEQASGGLDIEEASILELHFDNSFSYVRGKTVFVSVADRKTDVSTEKADVVH